MHPDRSTPQGGVVSPLLANLFLHYAFDRWMQKDHPGVPFERYADDAICHCKSEACAWTPAGAGAAADRMQVGSASGEDQNRVLQRPIGKPAIRSVSSTFWAIRSDREVSGTGWVS